MSHTDTSAVDLHDKIVDQMWSVPESEVASLLEKEVAPEGWVDLVSYSCRNFSRGYCDYLFFVSSPLWMQSDITEFEAVIRKACPRPEPHRAWDGGHFVDITFILKTLRLNALLMAQRAKINRSDLKRVLKFAAMNSDIIFPHFEENDEDEPDKFADQFEEGLLDLRGRILFADESLNVGDWDAFQLEDYCDRALITMAG